MTYSDKDLNSLDRFIKAQSKSFNKALKEVKAGYKRSHWMWFIFPQLRGIGYSDISYFYGIEDIEEAKRYYENDLLRSNLLTITEAFLNLNKDPFEVFDDDAFKLHSSMTLFFLASNNKTFKDVIDKFYKGKLCERTIRLISK